MLGTYTFVIWASDPAGNWGTDSGSFLIRDTTPPDITNIGTTSPQEIDVGAIDITATVTDNYDVTSTISVWITVLYPNGTLFENVSMTYDSGNGWFAYQNTFQVELGTYDIEIFAMDAQGNQNSVIDTFIIEDTQNPVADAGIDQSLDQGDLVTFDDIQRSGISNDIRSVPDIHIREGRELRRHTDRHGQGGQHWN
jgi:hypothetical protein